MASASSCSPRRAEPVVVVYTSVDQVYSEPILKEFSAATGIRVLAVYDVEATKTVGLVHRLLAEKRRPRADVFWNGECLQTILLKERGALAPYRSPSAKDIPKQYLDPEGYWAGTGGRARVLLVNTDLVGPDKYPGSIFDLYGAAWPADKVGMSNPLFGTASAHAAALYAFMGDDRARAFYEKLRDRGIRVVDGNSVIRDLVAGGQLMVGLTDSDDACGALRRGKPVKIIIPDQETMGTLVFPNTVALIKNAPHPGEATILIDFLLSPQVEKALVVSGYCQLTLRPLDVNAGFFPFKNVKGMKVSLEDAFRRLVLSREELKKIFVR